MAHTSKEIPRAAVRGIASGILFMAFFGTLWATIGLGGKWSGDVAAGKKIAEYCPQC
jgi:hypothetical protein